MFHTGKQMCITGYGIPLSFLSFISFYKFLLEYCIITYKVLRYLYTHKMLR